MTQTLAPLAFADAEELALYLNCYGEQRPAWTHDLGTIPGDLTELAVWAPGASPEHIAGIVGYFLRGPLAMFGEWDDGWAEPDEDGLVRFAPDLTKSRRDDWAAAISDPATGLAALLASGTPVRTTDRAGDGTRGTRKWGPLPGPILLVWR